MRHRWSETIKGLIRPPIYKLSHPLAERFECPICGYRGPFKHKREKRTSPVVREYSKCVRCGASERHRMQMLVVNEVFAEWDPAGKAILHIAPEWCLQPRLQELFEIYHTSDLFRDDVDFQEDIQKMSFDDASYDCVYVSRVMTSVPDLVASVSEMRRVLKPGGLAIISEAYIHETSRELGRTVSSPEGRAREVGMDAFEVYERFFERADRYRADRYDGKFQLTNRIVVDGTPSDDFPVEVRAPGVGYMELVVVCHA